MYQTDPRRAQRDQLRRVIEWQLYSITFSPQPEELILALERILDLVAPDPVGQLGLFEVDDVVTSRRWLPCPQQGRPHARNCWLCLGDRA
jgi:hypothetical protein